MDNEPVAERANLSVRRAGFLLPQQAVCGGFDGEGGRQGKFGGTPVWQSDRPFYLQYERTQFSKCVLDVRYRMADLARQPFVLRPPLFCQSNFRRPCVRGPVLENRDAGRPDGCHVFDKSGQEQYVDQIPDTFLASWAGFCECVQFLRYLIRQG